MIYSILYLQGVRTILEEEVKKGTVAALAAVALAFVGAAPATAGPYQTTMKRVTYTVAVKSGPAAPTMIRYQSGYGMTWDMIESHELPWVKSVSVAEGVMPNVYFYSMAPGNKSPVYTCSVSVNDRTVVARPSQTGQCLQSYPGQVIK